eukprot:TRINITY_DN3018_c0_g1_i1.p2 TRINITY_DN3018_c0_g1~~TRINITY_DN3018_c0_g1_i1.p2  ORF type:complete len:62 (-),score=4.66 TRINITY_DN3018_c0_g1_i1:266-451(-)
MNEVLQHDLVFQHLLKMLQLNQSRQLLHDEQHQTFHLTYLERFEELALFPLKYFRFVHILC